MREHTIARGLALSSVSGGLTCDLYHALSPQEWGN